MLPCTESPPAPAGRWTAPLPWARASGPSGTRPLPWAGARTPACTGASRMDMSGPAGPLKAGLSEAVDGAVGGGGGRREHMTRPLYGRPMQRTCKKPLRREGVLAWTTGGGVGGGGARACKRHTFRANRTAKMRPCSAPIFLSLRPHGINHAPPALPPAWTTQREAAARAGTAPRPRPAPPPPPRPWGPPAPCTTRKRPAHGVGSYAMWRGRGAITRRRSLKAYW